MTDDEKNLLVRELHELILRTVAGTTVLSKFGGVLYTLKPKEKDRQFCSVFIKADHVQLVFRRGAHLNDANGILVGREKYRRHVLFYSRDEMVPDEIAGLLSQAAKK